MQVVTIIYVTDMERSVAWYRELLPDATLVSSSPYWTELSLGGGASLALHAADTVERGTQVGVALTADRDLESLRGDLAARGVTISRAIQDEPFGRSMVIQDPDALPIQVNEHDAARYPTPRP